MLSMTPFLPESPRWLAAHDRAKDSLAVLRRVHAVSLDDDEIVRLHDGIIKVVAEELAIKSGSWKSVLWPDKIHSRRRFLIACSIQVFQQLSGMSAIICQSYMHLSRFLTTFLSAGRLFEYNIQKCWL